MAHVAHVGRGGCGVPIGKLPLVEASRRHELNHVAREDLTEAERVSGGAVAT